MGNLRKDRARLIGSLRKAASKLEGREAAHLIEVIEAIRRDSKKHYLSYSQDQPHKVSYAAKREHRHDNEKRTRTTLGRYLRRKLGITPAQIPDKVLHEITREVFAHLVNSSQTIRIISGRDITDAYSDAVGGSSCMTGDASEYTKIYADNPDKVSMVVLGINEARALLWNTDEGITVLDRIYPNDGAHVNLLQNWAQEKGYVYRLGNSLPSGSVALSDGNLYRVTLTHQGVFPYMDTFRFAALSGDRLTVSNDADFSGEVLDDTSGNTSEARYCRSCETQLHGDDYSTSPGGDIYCDSCFDEIYTYCDRCDDCLARDNAVTVNDDAVWCQDCADGHAASCSQCGNLYEDGLTSEDSGAFLCEACARHELKECADCAGLFKFDIEQCDDGNLRCSNCATKHAEADAGKRQAAA